MRGDMSNPTIQNSVSNQIFKNDFINEEPSTKKAPLPDQETRINKNQRDRAVPRNNRQQIEISTQIKNKQDTKENISGVHFALNQSVSIVDKSKCIHLMANNSCSEASVEKKNKKEIKH